ncbi:hypothetical protein Tco_1000689 [Tanacetum coccineum]
MAIAYAIFEGENSELNGVKSISLTEAEEEAVAREVHATHAGTVSGPDPEPVQEDQTGSNFGKLHVSLAGPNPEHMDDEFLATAYPKVHENLKLITDERVIEENPESHSGSIFIENTLRAWLGSIKNQESKRSPQGDYQNQKGTGEGGKDFNLSIQVNRHALIADEDAMDKKVAVKVKDHKRKHDSDDEEDDDDDEGPSAGSHQGRSAKRRRPESATSGSAQPPSKDDSPNAQRIHGSLKHPDSIQNPALTSTGSADH